nr:hypothetical protein [Pseudomonas sp. Marseille-Q3773]
MHVVISWDIHAKENWNLINEKLSACMSTYSWVKPLNTLYVVQVSSLEDRDQLVARLTQVAKQQPDKVEFLCTPVMSGGAYNGWLPGNMWNEINKRVN